MFKTGDILTQGKGNSVSIVKKDNLIGSYGYNDMEIEQFHEMIDDSILYSEKLIQTNDKELFRYPTKNDYRKMISLILRYQGKF